MKKCLFLVVIFVLGISFNTIISGPNDVPSYQQKPQLDYSKQITKPSSSSNSSSSSSSSNSGYEQSDDLKHVMQTSLKELKGTTAKEYGGGTGTQDVELAKYYIDMLYKQNIRNKALGNANMIYINAAREYPKLFVQIDWTPDLELKAGDIISFESKNHNYGHAGIVYEGGVGYKFSFLEQWRGSKTIRLNKNPKYYKSILGVARPIGEPAK
ncbi:MAG: CHAP domain-containing protein [Paludibacteraceae bacterium]|nr:CHAP domain-containing protein [Paludibacteraceae bacterium]